MLRGGDDGDDDDDSGDDTASGGGGGAESGSGSGLPSTGSDPTTMLMLGAIALTAGGTAYRVVSKRLPSA